MEILLDRYFLYIAEKGADGTRDGKIIAVHGHLKYPRNLRRVAGV